MSRATVLLLLILVLIVAALVFLSRRPATIAPHHIEQAVTLNGADGSQN